MIDVNDPNGEIFRVENQVEFISIRNIDGKAVLVFYSKERDKNIAFALSEGVSEYKTLAFHIEGIRNK